MDGQTPADVLGKWMFYNQEAMNGWGRSWDEIGEDEQEWWRKASLESPINQLTDAGWSFVPTTLYENGYSDPHDAGVTAERKRVLALLDHYGHDYEVNCRNGCSMLSVLAFKECQDAIETAEDSDE